MPIKNTFQKWNTFLTEKSISILEKSMAFLSFSGNKNLIFHAWKPFLTIWLPKRVKKSVKSSKIRPDDFAHINVRVIFAEFPRILQRLSEDFGGLCVCTDFFFPLTKFEIVLLKNTIKGKKIWRLVGGSRKIPHYREFQNLSFSFFFLFRMLHIMYYL